ncbi:MAG: phage terminase large subunit family protein [Phycisphaerae bacterium]|nr:phage terminase large subunit family protein [Phycisphaerae bacterium]
MVEVRHTPRREADGDPYGSLKERARTRNAALSLAGRDIGELPAVVNPERKARAERDFRFFCESYLPFTFHLPWSPDHLKVIAKIEQAVLHGGLFAMAMPRGSGKTSICECACIWAVLYGHREFVCLVGSDEGHAMDMLDSMKTELDGNDLLLEDFPEVVYPIQCLDGIANRCSGQIYQGERTHIGWTAREIVLPTMPGSKASGAIIKVAGITGRIRGMKFKRADGQSVRPSLVVIDDPQTNESARSLSQCATRESILAGAVLGLAGPGKKIAGVMPCTVIHPGDMADNILSREKHPEWNGERTKMVYSFAGKINRIERRAVPIGHNWRMPNVRGKRAVRHVVFDTNFWKSFVYARLAVAMGDRGCLSLFGDRADQHRLLAEHLTAEYRVKTEGRGRTVHEWKIRPERGDNHWLDGLVGCAVAASIQGAVLLGTEGVAPAKLKRVSFAELQRRNRR